MVKYFYLILVVCLMLCNFGWGEGASCIVVVNELCYKPGGSGFET
jgi:hypothetical protein